MQQGTTMNTSTRGHTASRFGRSFGRGWRACARCEQRVVEWLVAKGVQAAGATALVWMVKLAVLGVLLYFVFWLALVLVLLLSAVAGWASSYPVVDDEHWAKTDELRNGEGGFGLYSSDGYRIDLHDPNDPYDY